MCVGVCLRAEFVATCVPNVPFVPCRWGTTCDVDKQVLPGGLYFGNGSGFDATQWHTYAVRWTETQLEFAIDGVVFETVTSAQANIPQTPNYLILNTAVRLARHVCTCICVCTRVWVCVWVCMCACTRLL